MSSASISMCCTLLYPPSILSWITVALVAVGQAVDVNLANSPYPNQGRVEVFLDGEWGTICDEDWDEKDALVVCRELGFAGSKQAIGGAAFGEGSGRIHLTKVQCSGQESNIVSCKYSLYDRLDGCNHGNDAGVICSHENYPQFLVTPTQEPTPKAKRKGSTNWSDITVSIIFPAAILFAIYLIYRRLYADQTPPPTPNRSRSCQQRNTHRTEQYRVVPAPYGTMTDPHAPTDPDAPPPYDQVISERIKESLPIVTVSRDDMEPTVVFTPTTPSDDDTIPISVDVDEDLIRTSRV